MLSYLLRAHLSVSCSSNMLLLQIAKNVDTVLLSERKLRPFTTDCYLPSYHLSHDFTTGHYHSKLQKSEYYTGADKNNTDFFHGNVISTNIIVTVSRHLLFQQVLTNVVEIVKAEYLHKPIVSVGKYEHRQKLLVCSTNYVLTFTLRELLLLEKFQTKQKSSSSIVSSKSISNSEGFTCRMMPMIIVSEFEDLGMKKTVNLHIDHSNDLNLVPKLKQHFLNSYTLFTLDSFLEYLEGKTIMNNNNGREIFLVKNKKKHLFPDYETFLKLNYKDSLVKHIDSNIFLKIPDGAKLKSVMIDTKTSGKSGDKSSNDAIMKLSYVETERYLKNVSTVLNGKKIDCFGDDYAGTRDDYLNNVHKEVIGNVPIMVYPFCARTFQLGK